MERDKRSRSMFRGRARARPILRAASTHSVKELLVRRLPILKRVTAQVAREHFWQEWLRGHIPEPLCARVSAVVERDGTVTIFAESAAWSARLRYALIALEPQMRSADPTPTEVKVRVLPRGSAVR